MKKDWSLFGNSAFMGLPVNQVPVAFEFHDELDINHIMGCAKCKRKKKKDIILLPGMAVEENGEPLPFWS